MDPFLFDHTNPSDGGWHTLDSPHPGMICLAAGGGGGLRVFHWVQRMGFQSIRKIGIEVAPQVNHNVVLAKGGHVLQNRKHEAAV